MYSDKRDKHNDDVIAGRNAVYEALKSGRPVDSVLIAKGNTGGPVGRIVSLCREKGVTIKDVSPAKLDALCAGLNHQGVAAIAAAHEYSTVEDILKRAEKKKEPPFIIIADEINDPHNLGAIIRTAEAAGAHGIIIPKRGAVGLTAAVGKASCGALEYMPVARVSNLVSTVEELKKMNIWIYGAEMSGQPYYQTDFSGACALVIGSEGFGISRLLREKCDFLVSLPMRGKIESLNASVAAGILMYEIVRRRESALK
ncbi:putative TrmH family tRNA/rRNA methyltransferase YacO [[Clostridium] cellulosi]|uniref:Putative TrmH family tRNA/rRNA methyltransferase YacO n=1 Tax=[Clostridium] cellulosi TaxID=29343 RepID=A0A078KL47_9FIRM|nr:putative TrmH family tRNA/rRNA methyltransferase YacO [[Clostridium] cellulosi]